MLFQTLPFIFKSIDSSYFDLITFVCTIFCTIRFNQYSFWNFKLYYST